MRLLKINSAIISGKINSTVSDKVLPCPTEKRVPPARKESITVPVGKPATDDGKGMFPQHLVYKKL